MRPVSSAHRASRGPARPPRVARNGKFESSSLQRGVCKLLVPKPGESPEHLSTLWKSCMRFCVYLLLPIEPELFSRADRAIECHPGHYLGVRELAAAAANLPNAFVGLLPNCLEMLDQGALQRPRRVVRRESHAPRLIQRVKDLDIDVELKLISRGVADPNRCGALVATQPGHLVFDQPPFSG